MTPSDPCKLLQPALLPYALDTLLPAESAHIATHLAQCPECRDALDEVRGSLALLDGLPDTGPPRNLAARTIATVHAEAAERTDRRRALVRLAWVAAAACLVLALYGSWRYPALRAHQLEAEARSNLKQLGVVFKMYSNESRGELYPPLSSQPGVWAPDLSTLYPAFISDPTILVNPRLPHAKSLRKEITEALQQSPPDFARAERIAAQSFIYTGHALKNEEEAMKLADSKMQIARAEMPAGAPHRLREGIERFMITDINNSAASAQAQALVPVLIEVQPAGKEASGELRVLFMDGHVAALPYDQSFPASRNVQDIFAPPALLP